MRFYIISAQLGLGTRRVMIRMDLRLVVAVLGCLCLVESSRAPTAQELTEILNSCRNRNPAVQSTVPVSTDCRLYASCPFPMLRIPTVQHCAAGNFYNTVNQTCDFVDNVNCDGRGDPCNGRSDGYIEDPVRTEEGRPAGLWCTAGRSTLSFICDRCQSFTTEEPGCVDIPGCVADPIVYDNTCNHEAVIDNPSQYIAVGVKSRTTMNCPGDLVFDQALCLCTNP